MATEPLASCIMPTADRRRFVPLAIEYFLRQDYERRELIVIDDGVDAVRDLMPGDERVRYIRLDTKRNVGAKRNLACEHARGEIIMHWDDDDWMASGRVSEQVSNLLRHEVDICGLDRVLFFSPGTSEAWEYRYPENGRPWVYGASLCYRKDVWRRQAFPEVQAGEDARFVWAAQGRRIHRLADNRFVVAIVHADNTSPKRTRDPRYQPQPLERVREVLGSDWAKYASGTAVARPAPEGGRTALVSAAYGIGDLVRMTPLVRVLHRLGYRVDLLLAPDCAAATTLLEGAPEVRRVFHYRDFRQNRGSQPVPELAGERYSLAVFTTWSAPLQRWVQAERYDSFPRAEWLSKGDIACISRIARDIGWNEALPAPFAVASARRFDLAPGTVALHPGCKRDWPWKKWHGFDELARSLPEVVIIGTADDLENGATYFRRPFEWPAHARNLTGELNLSDTAALLTQCAALVSNDSGMMHLGVALGIPTFGIFGITSPQREMIPSRWMMPITKGLPCEPACRAAPWGRRDCQWHLECLRTMTADDVIERIRQAEVAVSVRGSAAAPRPEKSAVPPVAAEQVCIGAQLSGGIGDVLLASAFLQSLYDEFPNCVIDVFYHQPEVAEFVFCNARFVRAVHPAQAYATSARGYDLCVSILQFVRYQVRDQAKVARASADFTRRLGEAQRRFELHRGLADRQPALDGLWGRISTQAGRNVLDNIGYLGGVAVDRSSQLFLAPEPSAYDALLSFVGGIDVPYVTLHDGFDNTTAIAAGAATKCWAVEYWADLVSRITAQMPRLKVVQLGGRKSRRIPGVHVDLVDKTSLHQAAWLLKHSLLHIDTDSGLVHMARAVHTPTIALFGPTDADYYGYQHQTNIKAERCGNCWWSTPDWLAHCPRGLPRPECMESIAPALVAERALEVLGVRLRAAQAPTCGEFRLYDSALRQVRHTDLADLCTRLQLPLLPLTAHIRHPESGVYIHASKQWEYLFALEALAARHGECSSGLRIADVGGGRGALAPYLAALGHDVTVFDNDYLWDHDGDLSVEQRYRRWARAFGHHARFGSLYNLPTEDGAFDILTSISVVEHVPHKEFVLKEALRILKPGGLLILTFDLANQPERFEDGMRREIFSIERLTAALARLSTVAPYIDPQAVERSAQAIQADGVLGIPIGMTVAGLVLRKAEH